MTEATTEQPMREIELGTTVIYAGQDGEYSWAGPNDSAGSTFEVAFSYGRSGHNSLKCDPRDVAPATITILAKDDRVAVTKGRAPFYPHKEWRATIGDTPVGYFDTKREATAAGLRTVSIRDWHAGVEHTAPNPDDHRPLYNLNTTGSGIRSYFSCSCGWRPKTMPQRGSTMHVPFVRHAKEFGIVRDNLADARYADGYAAAGKTWNEWHAENPGRDPFTGLSDDERLAAARTPSRG